MTVSICIPTCNRPALAREAVESALAQSYRPIQILVADDSPDDQTERSLSDLVAAGTVRYVRNIPSLGQAQNCNRLFDLAGGDLVMLLHDDDLLLPDAVASLVQCFEEFPGITAAYGKQYIMGHDGAVDASASEALNSAYLRTPAFAGLQPSSLHAGLTAQFPNDGYLVLSAIARNVRYRADAAIAEACDFDFGLRLASIAAGFYFLDRYTAKYRVTAVSVSTNRNIASLTFDLLSTFDVPDSLEDVKQQQLRKLAGPAVFRRLSVGDRRDATRVYCSSAYGWRRRLSGQGIVQAALLLCPPGLARWALTLGRSARGFLRRHHG